ncbi:MAG: M56 family metallopeptidase, partial [Planctomycetota bacterium]
MAPENILSQEIVQKLGWTLLHLVWQAATIALLLGILLALLRKSTANLRYIIACAALGLIILLPIVTMQLVTVSTPQPITNIEPPPAIVIPLTQQIREISVVETTIPEGPAQHEITGTVYKTSWKQRASDLLEPALPYLVSAWLLGVFGLSLWHLGGWTQLQRLRRKMVTPVDNSLHIRLCQLSEKLRVKQAVQLVESALVQVPTVVGWLRPVILLPTSALTGLNSEQLEALLAHELAHIRRYDYLINMLQTVAETLGFYHPAVWWISHKIRTERENCCDDLAVSISGDRVRYARALTSMEEIRGRRNELAVAATGGNLFGRIHRLIGKDSTESSRTSWIPSVITILLIAIIIIPTTLALTGQSENNNDADIETLLINGFCKNRDKFKCGFLAWSSDQRNEIVNEGPRTGEKGTFQMWWDGKKITTKYAQERTDLDADVVTSTSTGGNVYDGKLFSKKPRFEPFENWFGGQVINWTGPMSIDQNIPRLRKRRNVDMNFSTVIVESRELIKFSTKNINKAAVDFGAYSIRYFDPSKGYCLVNEESYTADNRIRRRSSYKLKEVIPDGWLPVEVDVKGYSLKDCKVYMQRHLALDLERCRFNDPSAMPDGIFKFSANKEHEQLNDILAKFSGGTSDEIRQGLILAIVPNIDSSGHEPSLTKEEYQQYINSLAQNGPLKESIHGSNFRWFPVKGDTDRLQMLPLNIYKNQTYILLCTQAKYVMVPRIEGRQVWGLENIWISQDTGGRPSISFQFNEKGAELFYNLTKANIGNHLAICVDGQVLTAPRLESALRKYAIITGNFSQHEMLQLMKNLQQGMVITTDAENKTQHEQLNDIMKKLSDSAVTDKSDANVKGPLETIETFIAAALAGDYEKAATFIDRRRDGYEQAKSMREVLS